MTARHPLTHADCAAMRRAAWPALIVGTTILAAITICQILALEATLAASAGV